MEEEEEPNTLPSHEGLAREARGGLEVEEGEEEVGAVATRACSSWWWGGGVEEIERLV